MRLLALDLGEARIGVAVSDPEKTLARSLTVIKRRSKKEDFATIARLVDEMEAEAIVVGYPLSLNGEAGPQARRAERYARALAQELNIPVYLWDESFSTAEAKRLMIEAGHKRKARRREDAVAAAVILQDYLDSQKNR
ncbi:MAG: Holliday junction resolvase RuvX [Anaerolineae bacterium]